MRIHHTISDDMVGQETLQDRGGDNGLLGVRQNEAQASRKVGPGNILKRRHVLEQLGDGRVKVLDQVPRSRAEGQVM